MGNKIVNKGRIDELTDFVEDGGDVFRPGPFLQALELVFPEREKLGVGQPGVDLVSKIALGEHFDHIGQGSARNMGESQDGVAQNVLEPGSPGMTVKFVKNGDNSGGDQLGLVGVGYFKKV